MDWFFDDELAQLRWEWVSEVRAQVTGTKAPSHGRSHAVAAAYIERVGQLSGA